jgi:ribosome maturation factor RimP
LKEITDWLTEKFKEEEFLDCFLVDLKIHNNNQLKVYIDSDSSFTSGRCVAITRALRNYLEESDVLGPDFSLEVSSPGLDRPLQFKRQYRKNVGRELELTTTEDEKLIGELIGVDEEAIELSWKKKKEIINKRILFEDIEKAKIKISFNKKGSK